MIGRGASRMHLRSLWYLKILFFAGAALAFSPFDSSHASEVSEAKARLDTDVKAGEQSAKLRKTGTSPSLIEWGKLSAPEPLGPKAVLLSHASEVAMDGAIRHYESIVESGGWYAIPAGAILKKGDRNTRIFVLRKRLRLTGDLPENDQSTDLYDAQVEKAVMRFQTRHGLPATGYADARTVIAMNVPAEIRLKQLQLNRDRLRGLLLKSRKARKIVVNIPAYELQAIGADSQIELRARVVVGKIKTPTPELVANIRALNFFPYWHVPVSLVRSDLVPRLQKGANFLKREKIRVFKNWKEVNPGRISWGSARLERYVFRQDPGPRNALGVLRFDMPNRHAVYMHDTPHKIIFRFSTRASSAGCVRVANAPALARWLFENGTVQRKKSTENILQAGAQKTIRMRRKIPVFFVYLTAWPAGDGAVQFREDIYNRDELGYRTADYGSARKPLPTRAGLRLKQHK